MDEEEWRDVLGFEGLYQVSNLGRVRSFVGPTKAGNRLRSEPMILHTPLTSHGYPQVGLRKDGKQTHRKVHRLVCEAFHGPKKNGLWVCHLNGDKTDARAINLRWGTPKRNGLHSQIHNRNSEPLLLRFAAIIAGVEDVTVGDLQDAQELMLAFSAAKA